MAAADLLSLIVADMLAGCPHDEATSTECRECQTQAADDAADRDAEAAEHGSDEWRWACIRRIGAETRIATALGVGYRNRYAYGIPA